MTASPVRWATPNDDAALRRLCRRTPIVGPISYCLEREPDFFALTRIQGDSGGRIAVIDHGEAIVAMGMMAPHHAWIAGRPTFVAYLGDLKVDPAHRHKGLARRIIDFLERELDRIGIERSYFLALAGNPAFARVESSSSDFDARRIRSIRNYLVLFGARRSTSPSEITITRATPEDVPEMVELWNRVNGRRNFAPISGDQQFVRYGDFRIARRGGTLAGFCAAWDASPVKQIRPLRLSLALRLATSSYNFVARLMRRPRFPRVNECLRSLYVSQVCADSAPVLESLLDAVHDEHRGDGYLYFDIALDHGDPLTDALNGFRSMKVEFELWEAITPSHRAAARTESNECAYFDMAFV